MSNTHSPEAQKAIAAAENKLSDALDIARGQIATQKESKDIIVETSPPKESHDVEVVIEAPAKSEKEPRRSEFVQTDDPKIIERINDLYGQAKKSDARNQAMLEHNKLLEEKLAEYATKVANIERTTQDNVVSKIESDLKVQLRIAREENDFDAIDVIEDKLTDIRIEKKLASKTPPPENVPKSPPIQPEFDKSLVKNAAYIEILANEKDATGKPVRGYLYDSHPDNEKAVELFNSIPREFAAAGKQVDIRTLMEVLDERLRGRKSQNRQAVLGGDDSDAPARNVVKLSQLEIDTARKMNITPEAYARQKRLLMT